jgi:hypothetical protein
LRVIIVVVHVGAVKIYARRVEVLMKYERGRGQDMMMKLSACHKKIVAFLSFIPTP